MRDKRKEEANLWVSWYISLKWDPVGNSGQERLRDSTSTRRTRTVRVAQ